MPDDSEYIRGKEAILKELLLSGLVSYSKPEDVYFYKDAYGYIHYIHLRREEKSDSI